MRTILLIILLFAMLCSKYNKREYHHLNGLPSAIRITISEVCTNKSILQCKILVDTNGLIQKFLIKGSPPIADSIITRNLKQYRIRPAEINGEKVAIWVTTNLEICQ